MAENKIGLGTNKKNNKKKVNKFNEKASNRATTNLARILAKKPSKSY